MMNFIGIDLAWSAKNPSGLALLNWDGKKAWLSDTATLVSDEKILSWVQSHSPSYTCIAIDAPIIAPNPPGTTREADKALSGDFARFHAGTYPANKQRAKRAISLSGKLRELGFNPDPFFATGTSVRSQIEVYPHSAMVALFSLHRIIKYKKGPVAVRAKGLRTLQREMAKHLPLLDPPVDRISLLKVCRVPPGEGGTRALKELEDILDAVICAYTGLYFWRWGKEKCRVYGSVESGYIVTPINETILSAGARNSGSTD